MKRLYKNLLYRFCILTMLSACFNSCQKELSSDSGFVVTEQDAAEVISNSILPAYGGLISKINNTVTLAKISNSICGINKDTTIISPIGKSSSAVEVDYNLNWHYWKNCADQSTKFGLGGTNSYNGIHFSASDQSNGTFSLFSKTAGTANIYSVQLFQTRTGSALKKDVGNKTFTNTIILHSDSVKVDQLTGKIISGKITINITGSSTESFMYTGEFIFTNDHKATLKITNGNSYELSW